MYTMHTSNHGRACHVAIFRPLTAEIENIIGPPPVPLFLAGDGCVYFHTDGNIARSTRAKTI